MVEASHRGSLVSSTSCKFFCFFSENCALSHNELSDAQTNKAHDIGYYAPSKKHEFVYFYLWQEK
jgi:hypothetical protein